MDLAQVLIPAAAGILGAAIGGLFPIWAAGRADSRQSKRDDFVQRRNAYLDFTTAFRDIFASQASSLSGAAITAQSIDDLLDKLSHALLTIELVGSDPVLETARTADRMVYDMTTDWESFQAGTGDMFRAKHRLAFKAQQGLLNSALRADLKPQR